jgi:hypothetical protein
MAQGRRLGGASEFLQRRFSQMRKIMQMGSKITADRELFSAAGNHWPSAG